MTETIALVLGVSYYLQNDIHSLPAAEIDAVNFARALKNWGIPEKNILLLLNKEANKTVIDNFFLFLGKKKEKYKLVFYFCGHGHRTLKNPKSYLILYNGIIQDDACINSLSLDFFLEKISYLNASESYIFIDACNLKFNNLINPKQEKEDNAVKASKNLFCLFSSGLQSSFENTSEGYGYFTKALLNSLCKLKLSKGSPTTFLNNIQNEMRLEGVPLPEMINLGTQKISFLENDSFSFDPLGNLQRTHFIAKIQDSLIQQRNKIISISGEEGSGKTALCQLMASEKVKILHLEIPEKKTDLNLSCYLDEFFQKKLHCNFKELDNLFPYYLIIFDQLERLGIKDIQKFFTILNKFKHTKFLCFSRDSLIDIFNNTSDFALFHLLVPSLSKEEGIALIKKLNRSYSSEEIEMTYLISQGNPKKIKKMFVLDEDVIVHLQSFKNAIAALYCCGICYDKHLFEEIFNLQPHILDFFEKIHFIIPVEEGFAPTLFLNEFAESENLTSDPNCISKYWHEQAKQKPIHIEIAKSLILSIKCFGYQKKYHNVFNTALSLLEVNEKNIHYFMDGAEILLSLSYQTKTHVLVAKALTQMGEDELASKLLRARKQKRMLQIAICMILFLGSSLAYLASEWQFHSNIRLIYLKKSHPDFVGRENYIEILEKKLIRNSEGEVVPIAVLSGDAGIGKSEIAIHFANNNLMHFDLVHWINAATDESYLASYQHLAAQLNISFDQKDSAEKLLTKVHDHLENKKNHKAWLLIYDNAEKEYDLPQRGNGALLVTTRNPTNWHLYPCYNVEPFSKNEGLNLLKNIVKNNENPYQLKLIEELEYHPLSLNLAAHYIAETPLINEKLYLEFLSENKLAFLKKMPTDCRYPNGLLNTWKMTACEIQKKHLLTLEWLHFCSYLYPDLIPTSWIEDWLKEFFVQKIDASLLKIEASEILRLIVSQMLMRCDTDNKCLSIHRLKQEIVRYDDYFNDNTKENVLHFLVDKFKEYERADEMERNPDIWPKLKEWEVHAIWFLDNYSNGCSPEKIALLSSLISSWKSINGEYSQAENYINKALSIRKTEFGKKDMRTLMALNNKAWNLSRTSKFQESKILYTQTLKRLENSNLKDNNFKAFLLNNLSIVLKELREYQAMQEVADEALKLKIAKFGPLHAYTADSMHNLATAYWKLDEYEKAKHYFQQALNCYKFCYNENHPYVAITAHSITRVLMSRNEYVEAEVYCIQALNLYKKIYGDDHPYTTYCTVHFAQLLERTGREKEALAEFKKVFEKLTKTFTAKNFLFGTILEELKNFTKNSNNELIIQETNAFVNNYD